MSETEVKKDESYDSGQKPKATDRLLRSRAFLLRLLETIPAPIFFKDAEGRYRGGNTAWARKIVGLPLSEIIGKTIYETPNNISREFADLVHKQDMSLMKAKGETIYEAEVVCADGEKRDFQFNKATILNRRGEVIGIIGVMIDITERNRAQKLYEIESKQYKRFFLSNEIGIYQTNLAGQAIMVNPAFLTMFGFDNMEQLKNFPVKKLYSNPDDRFDVLDQLKTDGMISRTLVMRRSDGSDFQVRAMAKLAGDVITGYLTELKKASNDFIMVMCAVCFKIRDGADWLTPSEFFLKNKAEIKNQETNYDFSHAFCSKCGRELYGDLFPEHEEL